MEQTLGGHYRSTAILKSGRGVETLLGVDVDSGDAVVIKKTAESAIPPGARLRLEREAEALKRLESPCIAPLIDVRQDAGELFLVTPFVPGVTLKERLQHGPLDVAETLCVGAGLFEALREAHDCGVIHGDVKPANIVLGAGSPASVTLIDFGLSRAARPEPSLSGEPIGTLTYVSPEQAGLIRQDVGERSDLYSAGVVLFECLAGHPPFVADTVGDVLRQHITLPAPALRSLGLPVPRALDAVLERLLRKDPRDRYQSADAVLGDLDAIARAIAAGQTEPPLVVGARDRRRTLTEPAFVGRENELFALDAELLRAAAGVPRLVFVECESGGGKSRLLDELSVRAAQGGAWVLRGQATGIGAQRPLQVLDEVARSVATRARTDPALASTLRQRLGERLDDACAALSPLASLFEPARPAPLLDETHAEARSLPALVALLDALGAGQRPAVVLLDDCQWADELSLKLLAHWQRARREGRPAARVLVVAALRSEEVPVDHPLRRIAPDLQLALPPLGEDDLRRLAESMAGPLPTAAHALVERLSHGNPFLAVAALEGLTETGALVATPAGWEVEPTAMATAQSSRRGASFLARRLKHLPDPVRRQLSVAAVLGKTFDLELAADLAGRSIGDAMKDMLEARRRHLVWVRPGGDDYQFSHDRVRETLLERLSAGERKRLHHLAALRLAAEEPARPEVAFDLAYHFDEAGEPARALPHALAAARLSRARVALELAERNYRIATRGLDGAEPDLRRQVAEEFADVLLLRGSYDEAGVQLARALGLADSPVAEARIEGKRGELALKRGRVEDAGKAIERALVILGRRLPARSITLLLSTLWQAVVQTLHTFWPKLFLARRDPRRREADLLCARLYSRLTYAYWFYRGQVAAFWAHLHELNLAELHPPSLELAQAYSEHALGMTGLPRFFFARGVVYGERGLAIRRARGDLLGEGRSLSFYAMLLYAAGSYGEALARFREATRLFRRAGDRWEANIAGALIAFCLYRTGALREAVEECRRVLRDGLEIGDTHASALVLEPWAKSTGGDVPPELIEAALASSRNDPQTREAVLQAEALRLLRLGQPRRAVEQLAEAERLVRAAKLKSEYVSYLSLWRGHALRLASEEIASTLVVPRRRRLPGAERAIRRAVRIARRYRGNLPMALRERALLLARRGALRRALRVVGQSMAEADALGARFEYAQSLLVRGELERLRRRRGAEEKVARARALLHEVGGGFVLERAARAEPEPVTWSLVERFASVVDVGRRIASALDPDEIHQAVCAAALVLLRGESSSLLLVDEQVPGEARPVAHAGAPDRAPVLASLVARALKERRPVVLGETPPQLGSALAAPLAVGGRSVACLYVTHSRVGALFGDDEVRLAEYTVTLAGASLERAQAFAQLQALSRSLEQRVNSRTAELHAANQELDANLRRLSETQEQLLQAGKMAAIGTLVAGVSTRDQQPHRGHLGARARLPAQATRR